MSFCIVITAIGKKPESITGNMEDTVVLNRIRERRSLAESDV